MYDMNDMKFNPDTCLKNYVVKWYDKGKTKGIVLHDNEWKF